MFGSSWGNNNQQQQQPQPSTFGQPSAFGTSAFGGGTTGAFGQTQQQPQANPMFGNLGASTSNPSGGFGAFGGTSTQQNNAVNPMFGGAKPAAGFGAFGGGGNNAFGGGGGGAFGQTNAAPTTTAFGQPANTSAFGQPTNPMFGKPATTAFGAPAAAATQMDNIPAVTSGSSNPPYAPYSEKDAASPTVTNSYQSISCIPAYRGTSFEEIRLQDYAQGRKTAAPPGAFGQSSAFGGVQQQPTTNIFGQAQPAQQTSVFGGGAAQPTAGFGAFGNPAPAAAAAPAFGAFGQPQQQQQPTAGFGAFGQPQQQQQPQQQTSIFGGGTGAFGNNAAKPAGFGAFGATPAFGGNNAANPLGGNPQQPAQTGLFGQPAAAQPTPAFGAFGAANNNNAPKTNIFGQPAAQPATQNAFGGGTNIFGGGNTQQQPAQPATTGFGGFGTNNAQQQQQQPANPNPLFGGGSNPNPLFGGGGNAFGNNNQQQQQQPSLFGAKPAAPMFPSLGSTPTAAPSLFGNSLGQQNQQQQQQQQPAFGGGIFGAKAPTPALGQSNSMGQSNLFGGFNNLNGGMFSASASNAGAQGTLIASVAQPIATDLFSMLPPGPHAMNLEQSTKKKVPFFVDVPTRSPIPRVGLSYTPAGSKLRGFGASTSMSMSGSPGNPFAFSSSSASKPGVLSLSRGALDSPDSILRSGSPSFGSGSRHSVKKLILDKKVEPGELFSKSGGGGSVGSPGGRGKITFSPALSIAAREKETAAALSRTAALDSPTPAPRPPPANRFTAQNTQQNEASGSAGGTGSNNVNPEEGEYWVRPDLATLRQAGYEKLSSFKDLVVGRVGYGEIHFLEPVDLTGLPKLGALLGEVVRFDDKECSVYPDSDEVDKPPPGAGLNVRARLALVRCWAVDKATREPIKDAGHPGAVKHLKRLKGMKDTHFEGFDIGRGEWTFTVDHF